MTGRYAGTMQTTMDIDESVLREAESQARQRGQSLAALVEKALRDSLRASANAPSSAVPANFSEGLAEDDPFFAALAEIRARGRLPATHRSVELA